METKRKPAGFWKNWKNVERELEPIIESLGRFPSQKDLSELDRGDILNGIRRDQGGLSRVKNEMGYDTPQRQGNYWQSWSNFEQEMNGVISELNHFPSQVELRKIGRQDLEKGSRYHGSYTEIREKFGHTANQHEAGYWKEFSKVEDELKRIINDIEHFPTQRELNALQHSSLSYAIKKYHGGVNAVREKLGFSIGKTPNHHYKDWSNVESQLREYVESEGEIPSPNKLRKDGKEDLVRGVYAYHGGFQQARDRLGLKRSKLSSKSFYSDPDKVRDKLEVMIGELGRMPTTQELKGHSSNFYAAICSHFGGLKAYEKNYLHISEGQQLEDMLESYLGGEDE